MALALLCRVVWSRLLFFLPLCSLCHHLCWQEPAGGTSSSLVDVEGEAVQHTEEGEPKSASVPKPQNDNERLGWDPLVAQISKIIRSILPSTISP